MPRAIFDASHKKLPADVSSWAISEPPKGTLPHKKTTIPTPPVCKLRGMLIFSLGQTTKSQAPRDLTCLPSPPLTPPPFKHAHVTPPSHGLCKRRRYNTKEFLQRYGASSKEYCYWKRMRAQPDEVFRPEVRIPVYCQWYRLKERCSADKFDVRRSTNYPWPSQLRLLRESINQAISSLSSFFSTSPSVY